MTHSKLLKVLYKLAWFGFDLELHKCISVKRFGENWIPKSGSYFVVFDNNSLKQAPKFVLCNYFFNLYQKCSNG